MVGRKHIHRGGPSILVGLPLLLVALVALSTSGLVGPAAESVAREPLPFDPPSRMEQEVARDAAFADPRVQEQLGERHVFLAAALHTEKLPGIPVSQHPRLFDVWFYDYSSDSVVWAVVDLVEARVTEVVDVDFPFQPPLAGVEVERAVELAFGLDAVATRFPSGPLPATTMLVSGKGTACPQNRCVVLGFVEEGTLAMDFLVLVNLSEDRALKIIEGSWEEAYRP